MLIDLIILKTSICVVVKHDFVSTYSIKHIISVAVWCRLALFCIKCFPLQDLHELTPCVTINSSNVYYGNLPLPHTVLKAQHTCSCVSSQSCSSVTDRFMLFIKGLCTTYLTTLSIGNRLFLCCVVMA